jgi:hypothetical protein
MSDTIGLQFYTVKPEKEYNVQVLACHTLPISERELLYWKFPRLHPLVLLMRTVLR